MPRGWPTCAVAHPARSGQPCTMNAGLGGVPLTGPTIEPPAQPIPQLGPREPGLLAGAQRQQPVSASTPDVLSLPGLRALIMRHWGRLLTFSVIGAVVFTLQFVMQAVLVRVWHVGPVVAYIALAVICIQLSFLLNRRFTWGNRPISFWVACYRFNAQKAVTVTVNVTLYAVIVKLGMNYHLANVLTAGFLIFVNYAIGDSWAFASPPAQPGGSRR